MKSSDRPHTRSLQTASQNCDQDPPGSVPRKVHTLSATEHVKPASMHVGSCFNTHKARCRLFQEHAKKSGFGFAGSTLRAHVEPCSRKPAKASRYICRYDHRVDRSPLSKRPLRPSYPIGTTVGVYGGVLGFSGSP